MVMDREISLDAIYEQETGPVFMTGIQALVRLPLMQRRLDRRNGQSTAGLVTGYRGSPLGAYDQQLWKAESYLKRHDIVFQPGLNEDLAATALWGAQMHKAYGKARVDGVFGIWYGKGPGVDRSGDVFRTGNTLGTSPLGGILAVAGDDHAAQSSMYPHQTDGIFQSVLMPVLQPSNIGEILSLGLAGIAMSRFSGLWVAMKTIAEVVESGASLRLPDPYPVFHPVPEVVPPHGLNWDPHIDWPAQRAEYERRLLDERLPAALAWAAHNGLDRPIFAPREKRLCIITVGKAHQDLMQALDDLGLTQARAEALGIAIYKVAMSWPLDAHSLLAFSGNAQTLFVVEEKQPIVEAQVKEALFNAPSDRRPRVIGKTDEVARPLLPAAMEFSPLILARAVVAQLPEAGLDEALAVLEALADDAKVVAFPARKPFFCAGCPHNSSTRTPDGSVSGGGIGCHVMALSQPALKTTTFSQMGGEGAQWIGAAPFSETTHIFQNLGDGTYMHSGLLAIRAAVAAKTSMTFKLLYNDAVAMTGGQPAEGNPDPLAISRQLAAEGVGDIRLVSDDPDKWRGAPGLAARLHHRDELDAVQRDLREVGGVTAIIYEQTCAAEKRRRRKRNQFPDPDRRLYINPRVCEGCGDCSVQSNCIAVEPLETEFGRKRRINQSSCNKDFSCVKGFCPSFVEIDGPVLRKPDGDRLKAFEAEHFSDLPQPTLVALDSPYNVYVAGIGGLGVLTLGALLGAAAHLSGLESTVLDFTGLAQKNGAVVSQVRIAPAGADIHAVRIGAGTIDLMLATDSLVAAAPDGLRKLSAERSVLVINTDETPTADAVMDRDFTLPTDKVLETLRRRGRALHGLRASALAQGLFGDTVAANVMLLGYAFQQGQLPLSLDSLQAAIKANGAAVAMNLRALDWGRFAAIDLAAAERIAGLTAPVAAPETLDALVARRQADLAAYQDADYAARYGELVGAARTSAARLGTKGEAFVRAVAVNAYKLMAYKDEYEVARLYCDPEFRKGIQTQFSGTRRISIWLAPPLFSRIDPATGRPKKRKFGPWIFPALRMLSGFKFLRGTAVDPFGFSAERRAERALIADYFSQVEALCADLDNDSLDIAIALAALPADIRGYGPVKHAAMLKAAARRAELQAELTMRKTRLVHDAVA